MRRLCIAGNWKMNGVGEAARLLAADIARERGGEERIDIVIAPPFTALPSVAQAVRGSRVMVAAQDMHHEPRGAFTGEVSAPMIVDAGCRYVILGHSERRQHFGETDASIRLKVLAALANNLNPILCVGETQKQREAGTFFDTVRAQVERGVSDVNAKEAARVLLAYEPVWAIGTGRTASPEQAQEMHAFVRSGLKSVFGAEGAGAIRILYGGSVTPENAAELLAGPDVDGALVGGASLKVESFFRILDAGILAAVKRSAT